MGQDGGYRIARSSCLSSLGRSLRGFASGVAILFLLLQPFAAHAATIAYDNSTWVNLGGVSSGSFSYTNNGNLLVIYLYFLGSTGNSDKITGVTYNSVAATQIDKVTFANSGGGDYTLYAYALQNPASGSHSIAVTASATATLIVVFPESFSGANGGVEAHAKGSATADASGNMSPLTVTSVASGAWISTSVQLTGIQSISGYTLRAGSGHDSNVFDTNGTVSPGAHTPVYHNNTPGALGGAIALSISPTVASAASFALWPFEEF